MLSRHTREQAHSETVNIWEKYRHRDETEDRVYIHKCALHHWQRTKWGVIIGWHTQHTHAQPRHLGRSFVFDLGFLLSRFCYPNCENYRCLPVCFQMARSFWVLVIVLVLILFLIIHNKPVMTFLLTDVQGRMLTRLTDHGLKPRLKRHLTGSIKQEARMEKALCRWLLLFIFISANRQVLSTLPSCTLYSVIWYLLIHCSFSCYCFLSCGWQRYFVSMHLHKRTVFLLFCFFLFRLFLKIRLFVKKASFLFFPLFFFLFVDDKQSSPHSQTVVFVYISEATWVSVVIFRTRSKCQQSNVFKRTSKG